VSAPTQRLASFSPAKRRLLERLLAEKQAAAAPLQAFDQDAIESFSSATHRNKAGTRKFYDAINRQLSSTAFGELAAFLNYGYLPDSSPRFAIIELPPTFIGRNSAQLVLELIGDCDLTNKSVLDVGCGRGGTLMIVDNFFNARCRVGIDLSTAAIAFCNRTHRQSQTMFLEGDAEELPFAAAQFDVITNVESSHSYPAIESFYSEAWRILKPGGYFLYTDLFNTADFGRHEQTLRSLGFVFERERDITPNVLLSCRETAARRSQAFEQVAERAIIDEFLSTPESSTFTAMQSGAAVYKLFKLRKPPQGDR
jgi:phthiocerol/phenolphthiocerol synthesis type-I polyketide synthase E